MLVTNKHVVIAMLVSPVLAVLAWFAAGYFPGEQAQPATPGRSYPLVEASNCRWPSGACDLANAGLRLSLALEANGREYQLVLRASDALDGVVLGIGTPPSQPAPEPMHSAASAGREWRLTIPAVPTATQRIHLVALAGGAAFYADAATLFLQADGEP